MNDATALPAPSPLAQGRAAYCGQLLRLLGWPLLCGGLVFLVFDLSDLDLWVSDALYDGASGHFLLQQSALFHDITFRWTRLLPDAVEKAAMLGLGLAWLGSWQPRGLANPLAGLRAYRRDFLYVVTAFAVGTWLVQLCKLHTGVECPVEMARYGGHAAYGRWFQSFSLWHAPARGRCWPSGHAATGFNLLSLYFASRCNGWQPARWLLLAILLLGAATGAIRTLQGWHLLSHTLWSAVLVWFCMALLAGLFYGPRAFGR
ncbi:phosphatase PAP2 family protein [Pseudomonas sp. HR96]|uniref:phosphatase PAP2 family protein n=1 Tax=Pseudomonas sp. HR96 TaxID=1027966 RepID=UPI002A74C447|nr:phosphatase PAP2 family protein [Pseudomonas sp. HR96]WPO97602.1 phosphatase PAP2 family protein [Pseudomonas sp. HR96]